MTKTCSGPPISAVAVLSSMWLLLAVPDVLAQTLPDACTDGVSLSHDFDSGAAWTICARIDAVAGLEIRNASYRAPGDRDRPVIRSLHLAQLLLHWHDSGEAEPRLAGDPTNVLGGRNRLEFDANTCSGERVTLGERSLLCMEESATGLLAKYALRRAVQGEAWAVSSSARQGLLIWRQAVSFTEDGRLQPSVTLSGHSDRQSNDPRYAALVGGSGSTRATVLANWRMDFSTLDTDAADVVEEFDFTLQPSLDSRRPMDVRPLPVEAFRQVARERFRGWRVKDTESGAGYYLDPLDSTQAWTVPGRDWAKFDLALTRASDCEQLADANASVGVCGDSLDDFVDGETIGDAGPVLWFSLTKTWLPRPEDRPFLTRLSLGLELLPFDWTDASPFEVIE